MKDWSDSITDDTDTTNINEFFIGFANFPYIRINRY